MMNHFRLSRSLIYFMIKVRDFLFKSSDFSIQIVENDEDYYKYDDSNKFIHFISFIKYKEMFEKLFKKLTHHLYCDGLNGIDN
ncbi:protein of unknown function [Chryseobacterium sp. JV274]|nr:protein of unknown function [Chryseobacterium sp. JV274]